MKVSFFGSACEYTHGEKSYEFPADCLSVRDLIDRLGGRFGEDFRNFLLGNETCLFLVNGKGLAMSGGLDTELHSGDKIEVVPFINGG